MNTLRTIIATVICANAVCCAQDVARIAIPSQAAVGEARIALGEVAQISCSNPLTTRMLAAIDIGEFLPDETSKKISLSFIAIRVQLAGFGRTEFEIDGARTCQVEYRMPSALTDSDVEAAGVKAFSEVLGCDAKDVRVRLTRPFMGALPKGIREKRGLRAEVMPPIRGGLGMTTTLVRLWHNNDIVMTRNTPFKILQKQNVAMILASLRKDQPIDPRHVRIESRFVSAPVDQASKEDFIGKVATRDLKPGQTLFLTDMKSPAEKGLGPAVKTRDSVEVEAVAGRLLVRLPTATALGSGDIGDKIQFRNLESGRVRTGRIVANGRLRIEL